MWGVEWSVGLCVLAYSRDIGTRGDVFYWKQRRDEKQYGVEGQKATKYYMWKDFAKFQMFGDKKEIPQQTFRGKTNLWETHLSADAVSKAYHLYAAEDKKAEPSLFTHDYTFSLNFRLNRGKHAFLIGCER